MSELSRRRWVTSHPERPAVAALLPAVLRWVTFTRPGPSRAASGDQGRRRRTIQRFWRWHADFHAHHRLRT